MSDQNDIQATAIPCPTSNDPKAWKSYWDAKGQEWRTEPEIDLERQKELAHCLTLIPDIDKGVYPFKGVKLSRADVEWLLAESPNGQELVDNEDENRPERTGIDLRGAHLQYVDLKGLPLAGVCGGLQRHEWVKASAEQCEAAAVHLERADLRFAHLEKADLQLRALGTS